MNTPHHALSKLLRNQLEATIKVARDEAERGALAALRQLAISEARVPDYLKEEQKALRRRLRAHGRALGDVKADDDTQEIQHLVWEVAYQHWHRMLFARFLADNNLLIYDSVAVTLEECEELAPGEGAKNGWELAGKLASLMLPQVFKPGSPVFDLSFAPEHQSALERLLKDLPDAVFKASDSLGWVYQFWQANNKERINKSEVKIGADELPAVTQLFTEQYMVAFLLHNSLGAWWATRYPTKPCPVDLDYFRSRQDGAPVTGKFESWPNTLADFRLLDPCCGSGHFLVAAFLMLVPMRMATEGLSAKEAVNRVLAENIHGLELDPRCVEIAVFAVALEAWRYPDEAGRPLGVRDIPPPNIACCGLKVAAKAQDWEALVPDDISNIEYVRQELRRLHASFSKAPLLGSLLDPTRTLKNDLATSNYEDLISLVSKALGKETSQTQVADVWDAALSAQSLLSAAQLLSGQYHLIVTNVPYLGLRKQGEEIRSFCETNYQDAKADLATVMTQRCLELVLEGGLVFVVTQNAVTFKAYYEKFRNSLLKKMSVPVVAPLGPGAFSSITGEVVDVALLGINKSKPTAGTTVSIFDVQSENYDNKISALKLVQPSIKVQSEFLSNPGSRIQANTIGRESLLSEFALCPQGIKTGDDKKWLRYFYEITESTQWQYMQSAHSSSSNFGGCEWVINWTTGGLGMIRPRLDSPAVGKIGIGISQTGSMRTAIYLGVRFDSNIAPIIPKNADHTAAIISFCQSLDYSDAVSAANPGLFVTNSALLQIPFDLEYWQTASQNIYSDGIPRPFSDDPTQWLFHGHPQPATDSLQVAVARLLGYSWPAETDTEMELSDEARTWIDRCQALASHRDDDGIVCLPSVRGELPAHERLLNLLIASWETVTPGSWKPPILDRLLAEADCAGKGLDVWLREKFFEQHTKLFHHHPFIWHIWDGLKDGFSALVNYHQLDSRKLERLIHTYLGDWIRQQEEGVRNGIDGADIRLAAAQDLKQRLSLILEGEDPYDIFVRWKPLAQQPIGWNPDLNDGVRLNIRPFMTAEVLRHNKKPKLNITWQKDRGKDVESAPWFHTFGGDRINDYHLTLAEKQAARSAS